MHKDILCPAVVTAVIAAYKQIAVVLTAGAEGSPVNPVPNVAAILAPIAATVMNAAQAHALHAGQATNRHIALCAEAHCARRAKGVLIAGTV